MLIPQVIVPVPIHSPRHSYPPREMSAVECLIMGAVFMCIAGGMLGAAIWTTFFDKMNLFENWLGKLFSVFVFIIPLAAVFIISVAMTIVGGLMRL